MEVIFDTDMRAISRSGLFGCGDNHIASFFLIEAVVVSMCIGTLRADIYANLIPRGPEYAVAIGNNSAKINRYLQTH